MIQLKTEKDIDGIRKSCKLLAALFAELDNFVKEGLSTKEIDKYCYDFAIAHKAYPSCLGYEGYPASTCISVNDTVIHGIPSKKEILHNGDIVSIDICLTLNGYVSDSTHTYEIGKVSPEVHQLNTVTRKCLDLGIEAASKKGARIQDIGAAVSQYARKFGYGVVKDYCGHGVGFDVHEEPEVANYTSLSMPNPRLKPGMVIAIEPMINMGSFKVNTLRDGWTVKTIDGKPACHWEHTVAITENGLEVLTEL
jgi:methionine aminopeptidase, type I